jgi:hypothetical protein
VTQKFEKAGIEYRAVRQRHEAEYSELAAKIGERKALQALAVVPVGELARTKLTGFRMSKGSSLRLG